MSALCRNIEKIQSQLAQARLQAPLAAEKTILLAASKNQPITIIKEALGCGLMHFGENRVQEAQDKWPVLRELFPASRLHLIGPLQTNKVALAVELFDYIQTIDRIKLANALADSMARLNRRPACFIQINTGQEPQKAGVMPAYADGLIDYCLRQLHLPIAGLMCIPPANQLPTPHFALLRKLAHRHGIVELSMGMSDDFELAARMGSSCVRVGRALFNGIES